MAGKITVEKRVLLDVYGKWLWVMRRQPSHAAYWLTGIVLPSHERYWIGVYMGETKENNVIASRGTSKSFTHASAAAPLESLLYKNVSTLLLSASGFRGGKELFKDGERMILGQLKSQQIPGSFFKASIDKGKTIQKDPSIWTMAFKSYSRYSTVPTNQPDQLRGLRANKVIVDERNTYSGDQIQRIVRPMLNVGASFRKTAEGGDRNKIYQISTIDYTVRDWYPEIQVAQQLQKREYDAHKARKAGDWAEYDRLMSDNDGQLAQASYSLTRFDYTDLIIPEYVATIDGQHRYRVAFPMETGVERNDILRHDKHAKVAFWYLYPVDVRGLTTPLRDGTVDLDLWLAEQRNIFINASGNVFDFDLIQKVAERPIPIGNHKRKKTDEDDGEDEFYAPVMYSCGDPCVLGVDVARESDESAFVVIRLGELSEEEFSPFMESTDKHGRPLLGHTNWNHVCWAESWRKLQAYEVADKIHDLYTRYNIIRTVNIAGIAMDKRGGGTAVRDELGNPKAPMIDGKPDPSWSQDKILKIFDPDDENGFSHFSVFNDPSKYWGGLRLLATQNEDNLSWTYGAKGMMQTKKLYIGFWMPPSRWAYEKGLLGPNGEPDRGNPEYRKWEVGYNGIRRLKNQLLRLQTKITETGVQRFVMPGDRAKEEGKKDLAVTLTYAFSLAREHIKAKTVAGAEIPMIMPILVEFDNPFGSPYAFPF